MGTLSVRCFPEAETSETLGLAENQRKVLVASLWEANSVVATQDFLEGQLEDSRGLRFSRHEMQRSC